MFFKHLLFKVDAWATSYLNWVNYSDFISNSFLASGNFCRLLTTFADSLDPYQECRSWSGSKLFDTLILFLKEFFEKVNFEKSQQMTLKAWKITHHAKI